MITTVSLALKMKSFDLCAHTIYGPRTLLLDNGFQYMYKDRDGVQLLSSAKC
jgi:hypothetical protein